MNKMPDNFNIANLNLGGDQQIPKQLHLMFTEYRESNIENNSCKDLGFSFLPAASDTTWCKQQNSLSNNHDFTVMLSQKHGVTLPPLASVFAPNLQMQETREAQTYDSQRVNVNYSSLSDFSNCAHLPLSISNCRPNPLTFVESNQTTSLSNQCFQNFFETDAVPSEKSSSSSRKRRYSFSKDNAAPPNVNVAFKKLRNLIPTEPADRRLSKVETLRLAVSYIQHLGQTLNSEHWVDQPCLMDKPVDGGNEKVTSQICTFCMSKKRKLSVNSR